MNKQQFLDALAALPESFVPRYQYPADRSGLRYHSPNTTGGTVDAQWCPITAVAAATDAQYAKGYPYGCASPNLAAGILGLSPRLQSLIMDAADDDREWRDGPFKRRLRRVFDAQVDKAAACAEGAQ